VEAGYASLIMKWMDNQALELKESNGNEQFNDLLQHHDASQL